MIVPAKNVQNDIEVYRHKDGNFTILLNDIRIADVKLRPNQKPIYKSFVCEPDVIAALERSNVK